MPSYWMCVYIALYLYLKKLNLQKFYQILITLTHLADCGAELTFSLVQLFLAGIETLLEVTVLSPQVLSFVLNLVSFNLRFSQLLDKCLLVLEILESCQLPNSFGLLEIFDFIIFSTRCYIRPQGPLL